ncbi:MAG: hydantoinase/oxoprolinase family protein [Burkholderiales bacterium]|nr:hydantoinase/oxoprolinase family protein [Burkholderiales bacterium]
MARRKGLRLGVDVGGTFTDLVLQRRDGSTRAHKQLSTPSDPSQAVADGLAAMAAGEGLTLADFMAEVDLVVHGTTVTTNAVLTGRTARTALLATRGLTDALQMRRGIREQMFDNRWHPSAPVVPRELRLPVGGRFDVHGRELEALDTGDLAAAIARARAAGVEAVAICFMHAHVAPAHERQAAAAVRAAMPDAYLSVSSDVLPQVRYYERTSTTALNAAVGPVLARYLDALAARLAALRWQGTLLVMQSNGGVASLESVRRRAAATLLSGPAAAPAAALACLGGGRRSFVSVDMGGTSFDAVLVREGLPEVTTQGRVDGYALALPGMEIHTIGAGGGSIAWVDDGGLLHMGPQSAGADPGPACYGRGGREATSTDADLVLGYVGAERFAGGRIRLDVGAAEVAIDERVAARLGVSRIDAAWGMFKVINVAMAAAIREVSVRRGYDPREQPLACAGGAGPVHGAAIAAELGIRRMLVPRDASTFCASGMLHTDLVHDDVRSLTVPLPARGGGRSIRAAWREMARRATAALAAEGFGPRQRRLRCRLDLRYAGQYHEVDVEVSNELIDGLDWPGVRALFDARHERLYGYCLRDVDAAVELINLRLAAAGITDKPRARRERHAGGTFAAARIGRRAVYLGPRRGFRPVAVFDGEQLHHGQSQSGPAIIELPDTSIVVPPAARASVDALGHFWIDLSLAREAA